MFFLIFALLFIKFYFISAGEFDFTIEVEPGKLQCFFQPVEAKHKTIEIEYQVLYIYYFIYIFFNF